jgi:NADH:ubiquinone oxidoreductase subunit 3 (subunit A)
MESIQNKFNKSESITMDLENLQLQYSNVLIKYKQAVSDYVNYLNIESQQPCDNFIGNSIGIDQKCYDFIWKQAGCTTQAPNASGSWQSQQTMNGLIQDSWNWATKQDYQHRMGCYSDPGNPYIILGVGTDGNLYSRQGLDAAWQKVNDDSNGNLLSVFTHTNGNTLYGVNKQNLIIAKNTSWDQSNWEYGSDCCITSAAMGQDSTIVGVGMDHKLWSEKWDSYGWTQTSYPSNEWVQPAGVAIAPDGSLFYVGYDNHVYKKNSYLNLTSQDYQYMGDNTCCVKAITIAPDGTFIGLGTDNQLYTKPSYKDLTPGWTGPYNSQNSSCCVTSITTVINSNFNQSNYNNTTEPDYDLNKQPLVQVQGQSYIGKGISGQSSASSLQECQAQCASNPNCTGATFISNQCQLNTGEGIIMPSSLNSVAIVPKGKQLLSNINDLNQQLLNINQQITNKISSGEPIYYVSESKNVNLSEQLKSNYNNLLAERDNIKTLLNEYKTLGRTDEQNGIKINQNYYTYVLLFILVGLVIFLLIKLTVFTTNSSTNIQFGGRLANSYYYSLIPFFIIVLILLLFTAKKSQ